LVGLTFIINPERTPLRSFVCSVLKHPS